ncbi:MAG: hypothetical protein ACK53Z_06870 [Betaproteobacteria bacterium]|jgi:hypothetical protein
MTEYTSEHWEPYFDEEEAKAIIGLANASSLVLHIAIATRKSPALSNFTVKSSAPAATKASSFA